MKYSQVDRTPLYCANNRKEHQSLKFKKERCLFFIWATGSPSRQISKGIRTEKVSWWLHLQEKNFMDVQSFCCFCLSELFISVQFLTIFPWSHASVTNSKYTKLKWSLCVDQETDISRVFKQAWQKVRWKLCYLERAILPSLLPRVYVLGNSSFHR